ncbi:radical SAM protein [Desulfarculus baarsii]|uniref:radical SAM protein n=1 Tax=Desulfarculus baarsii TaxID=453230 RepID=UPI0002E25254|nr:radical SAM protein [Desulfarculus baarsii]
MDVSPFECRPRELDIALTGRCNLSCAFCYQGRLQREGQRPAPEEQVLGLIDWAEDNDAPVVRFTGGEPTPHPSIGFFGNYARAGLEQRHGKLVDYLSTAPSALGA